MPPLDALQLKTFVPAKDFALSKAFYTDMGFEQRSEHMDIAFFAFGESAFLLQNFYRPAHAHNMVMHLLVSDVQAWFAQMQSAQLAIKYASYGVRVTPLQQQPWGMTEFAVIDPCGVCWHIAQNTPGFKPVGRTPEPVQNLA
ncbi:MAG: glyoxalase [Brachymonas sp.]|nr:glyoxalase [Brachymonas sp.]